MALLRCLTASAKGPAHAPASCAAIPIQTRSIDPSNARITTFQWVIGSAVMRELFIAHLLADGGSVGRDPRAKNSDKAPKGCPGGDGAYAFPEPSRGAVCHQPVRDLGPGIRQRRASHEQAEMTAWDRQLADVAAGRVDETLG